jgi:RNA polymerase sigma factor (sigma-70 family)
MTEFPADRDWEKAYLAARAGDKQFQPAAVRNMVALAMEMARFCHGGRQIQQIEDIAFIAARKALTTKAPWDQSKGGFRAWFSRVVANTAIDRYKKTSHSPVMADVDETNSLVENIIGGDEKLDVLERDDSLRDICDNLLSDKEAMVFGLAAMADLSQEEIAERLEIGASTVRDHWRAARDISILRLAYLEQGMSLEQISHWFVPQSTPEAEHARLCWALRHIRGRPGSVRIAELLIAEKKWRIETIANIWKMPVERVRCLVAEKAMCLSDEGGLKARDF